MQLPHKYDTEQSDWKKQILSLQERLSEAHPLSAVKLKHECKFGDKAEACKDIIS